MDLRPPDPALKYRKDPVAIDAHGLDILTNPIDLNVITILDGELYVAERWSPTIVIVFAIESFDADRLLVVYREVRTLTIVDLRTKIFVIQHWYLKSSGRGLYVVRVTWGYKYSYTVKLLEGQPDQRTTVTTDVQEL